MTFAYCRRDRRAPYSSWWTKGDSSTYHIDSCAQCGSLLIRELPRCLACGYNVTTGETKPTEATPASSVLPAWDDIVHAVTAHVARLRCALRDYRINADPVPVVSDRRSGDPATRCTARCRCAFRPACRWSG
jgi:hypothetical protein